MAHEYAPAGPSDLRSPCPALNTLANHGYLPRDGRLITADMLVKAVKQVFNMDPSQLISTVFPVKSETNGGVRSVDQVTELGTECINLCDLGRHAPHTLEHDVSLTRNDAYFGDNVNVVPGFVEALIAESTDGDVVSEDDLIRHRLKRYNDSKARNPELSFNLQQTIVATFEATVALNVLGRDNRIPVDHVRSFFREERIPANWVRPLEEVSILWSEIQTAELLGKWAWSLTFNTTSKPAEPLPVDTRTFELVQFKSDLVAETIIPSNTSNTDAHVPAQWHGVFYTDGNPLPDELCSIANGSWHEGEDAYYLPVYGPGIWGWDDSLAGRALYAAAKLTQLNYKIKFDAQTGIASFHAVLAIGTAHHHTTTELPDWFGSFTAIPTENPNIFTRKTVLLGQSETDYRLVKILNADGSRTPEFESIYMARINKDKVDDVPGAPGKSAKTHLRATQLVAQVASGDSRVAKYVLQIATKEEMHGMQGADIDLVVFYSKDADAGVEVNTSKSIRLAQCSNMALLSHTGTMSTSVNDYEVEELGLLQNVGHVHAIALHVLKGGLFSEWYIESLTIKKVDGAHGSRDWYFPSFSWVTAGEGRVFFNGAETHISSDVPALIRELRQKDLERQRKNYVPKSFIDGLPIGIADNFDDLYRDEKANAGHFLGLREVDQLGLKDDILQIKARVKDLKAMENLYIINKRPEIIDTWRDDSVFGRQTVAGINPMVITAISIDPTSFPPSNFKDVSRDSLTKVPVLVGKSIDTEISQGRFSIIDYKPMLSPFVRKAHSSDTSPSAGGTVCAPVGLFWHDVENSHVYPVAIQLEEGGEVFYPVEMSPKRYAKPEEKSWLSSKFQELGSLLSWKEAAEAVKKENSTDDLQWLLVKMWFSLADAHVHELSVHLFKSHLCIEPFAVACVRQLASAHPIYKLLRPHTIGTMQINVEGREIFIGLLADIFSIGDRIIPFFAHIYSTWDFECDMNPVKDLERRGFYEGSKSSLMLPGQFPWAEDTWDLFAVIKNHASKYVDLYYASDAVVVGDVELQAFIKEAHEYHRQNKGLPAAFETKKQLVQVLTNVIWTASAQHSSINYPQYDYYSYTPNKPGKSTTDIIKDRTHPVTEATLAAFLPPIAEMELAINTVQILATYDVDEVFLGERREDFFGPTAHLQTAIFDEFKEQLVKYDGRVKQRNATVQGRKEEPYQWLLTNKIVNSTKV
ncbi:lipoxygenase [Chytriomyces sp. MP71]|nr:lipoxygenase [Chytriomyces sp. MP71]